MFAFAAARANFGLATIPHEPGRAGGADQQGQDIFLVEEINLRVALRNIAHDPRHQFDPVERHAVVAHRHLVLAALVAEVEQGLGQPASGHAT